MKYRNILISILFIFFICGNVFSQVDTDTMLKPLKGITKLSIFIANMGGKEYGITDDWLKTYIEGKLKKEGIEIIDIKHSGESVPLFRVWIVCQSEFLVLRFEVYEGVYLERDRSIHTNATTWENFVYVPLHAGAKTLTLAISEQLENFLILYSEANKKR